MMDPIEQQIYNTLHPLRGSLSETLIHTLGGNCAM
jgi:hypothetical protein